MHMLGRDLPCPYPFARSLVYEHTGRRMHIPNVYAYKCTHTYILEQQRECPALMVWYPYWFVEGGARLGFNVTFNLELHVI